MTHQTPTEGRDYLLAAGTPWAPDERPSIWDIIRRYEVEVPRPVLLGRTRRVLVAEVRQRAMAECVAAGHLAADVARAFGRDRTTVMHAAKKMGAL